MKRVSQPPLQPAAPTAEKRNSQHLANQRSQPSASPSAISTGSGSNRTKTVGAPTAQYGTDGRRIRAGISSAPEPQLRASVESPVPPVPNQRSNASLSPGANQKRGVSADGRNSTKAAPSHAPRRVSVKPSGASGALAVPAKPSRRHSADGRRPALTSKAKSAPKPLAKPSAACPMEAPGPQRSDPGSRTTDRRDSSGLEVDFQACFEGEWMAVSVISNGTLQSKSTWDHEGILAIRTFMMYSDRWIGVRGQGLHVKKEAGGETLLALDLFGAVVTEEEGTKFSLSGPHFPQGKILRLRARSPGDYQEWLRVLFTATNTATPWRGVASVAAALGIGRETYRQVPSISSSLFSPASKTLTKQSESPESLMVPTLESRKPIDDSEAPSLPEPSSPTSRAMIVAESDLEGWKLGPQLGKGAFGCVHLALLRTGQFVAVKAITLDEEANKADALAELQNEIDVMKSLDHPNIVRYFGSNYSRSESILRIFLEYVPQGSLSHIIKEFGPIEKRTVRTYLVQILEGVAFLHKNNVIHRDLKCDNVLIEKDATAKLGDFGCAKKLDALLSMSGAKTLVGTPYYMAPEVISSDSYDFKADIWSLGCTVIEMITGTHPWPEFSTPWAILYHITNAKGPPSGIPGNLDPSLQSLLDACFHRKAAKRPTALELLQFPFLCAD
eukprot:NODE_533_length_2135_cov_24.407478_g491_i0.p1 GENE.NODE_533_length_2135_cov_24.407478_g491_i0~~NODE_533_length_2135_cov_24.407478_g491_i0.p1  ORF type:complete len:710 (+),score=100.01 NODE_533_length_2135_cov_24.407478_g491_i0:120-2132(+)